VGQISSLAKPGVFNPRHFMTPPNPTAPMPRVAISQLNFSDGTEVAISPNDIVLVVGPNNAGKSAALRAIRDKLQNASSRSPVLQNLVIQRTGTIDEFTAWLLGWTVLQTESPPENPVLQALGQALHQTKLKATGSEVTAFLAA